MQNFITKSIEIKHFNIGSKKVKHKFMVTNHEKLDRSNFQ